MCVGDTKKCQGVSASASTSSTSVPTTICGRGASVSNKPLERFMHAASMPADSAPITSNGFEEMSRTDPMGWLTRFATGRYTFGDGLHNFISSTLTNPWKYVLSCAALMIGVSIEGLTLDAVAT